MSQVIWFGLCVIWFGLCVICFGLCLCVIWFGLCVIICNCEFLLYANLPFCNHNRDTSVTVSDKSTKRMSNAYAELEARFGPVPSGKNPDTYYSYLQLPETDEHCAKVDVKSGLWYNCLTCGRDVTNRSGRPFTMGRWNEHKENDSGHVAIVRRQREVRRLKLKQKNDEELTSLETDELKQLSRKQVPMGQFFGRVTSKKEIAKSLRRGMNNNEVEVFNVEEATSVTRTDSTAAQSLPVESNVRPRTCEGVFPDYRKPDFQPFLKAYCLYASINSNAHYVVDFVGASTRNRTPQMFARECTRTNGEPRGVKNPTFQCDHCHTLK